MAAFLFATSSFAQTGLTFDKIRVSGPASVELRQGEVAGISIEGDNTTQNLRTISNTTEDGWLVISGSADDIVVTANKLTKIDISGSGKLESEGVFNTDEVELKVTGAGKMDLNLVAQKVKCVISGAGKIELEGSANAMQVDISGAGKIDAENFKVKTCTANISGSGKCLVDVSDELTSNISGSGSVYYITKPANLNNNVSGAGRVADANVEVKDTTRISLGSKKILIIDGDGSSVRIGFKDSVKTEPEEIKSHWAGFEMGVNMLMNDDFSTTPPAGYEFLEPRIEKSIAINFNLIDYELKLYRRNIMLVTGLGYSINNFRFKSDQYLAPNANTVTGVGDSLVNLTKNKLVVNYINVPLLLEFNTGKNPNRNFHFATGVIGGLRVASHVKLVQEINGDESKKKVYDDFNLNPFRCDATVRMGYGKFTVFASYGLVGIFKDGEGPEMYPFTAGVKFIGW